MSGGRKKRRDIKVGLDQANAATQQGVTALNPYAGAGIPALGNANALLGFGSPEAIAAAQGNFNNSLFYKGGENAFNIEKDAIDAGLSNQGLLFSQARINGVEEARQRNYQNALAQYLGLNQQQAGIGLSGAAGQANLYGQQGQNALNAGFQTANTRQGLLGTLGQISEIGKNIGEAYSGFSDRRLKTDIEAIGSRGPLTEYRWRWNDKARDFGLEGKDTGFMADEVEKIMPEAVGERYGFKTVNYGMLSERLG